jgi:archaellum component FlaG (FlaF/FlaG flagellin family)
MIITQEMARTMLMDSKLTDIFWTHTVHTSVHIQNRVMLINNNDKTPYELWKGSTNNNLYIKVTQGNILLIEIYVDDIVLEVLMTG